MDDELDTTDRNELLGSPTPAPHPPSQATEPDDSLEAVLAQCTTDFMHTFASSINQRAVNEANETEEFRQELRRRLFRAIIRTYVWSTARVAHETELAERRLTKGVQELLTAERDQGRSSPTILGSLWRAGAIIVADLVDKDRLRGRLSELMAAVSKAVEMFTEM